MKSKETVAVLRERAEKGMDDKKCSESLRQLICVLSDGGFIQPDQNLGPVAGGKGYVSLAWIDDNTTVEVAIKRRK